MISTVVLAITMLGSRPWDLNLAATVADWRDDLDSGGVGHYVIIGDSISYRVDQPNWYLRDLLESDFGNAGDGYLAFGSGFSHVAGGSTNRRPGLLYGKSKNIWSEFGSASGPRNAYAQRSIDGIYSRIGAKGWIEVSFYGPRATLHYIKEPGAGRIRISKDGVVIALVNANATSESLATYTFETGALPGELVTIRFSLTQATIENPNWTQLNGLQMFTDEPGVMYSRLSRGSEEPLGFLQCDGEIFNDSLGALAPDLVIVMADHTTSADYYSTMNEMLDRIELAVPDAEILLVSHHHFRESAGVDADVLVQIATERGVGFLNLFDLHTLTELQALGHLADNVHFTAAGGAWHGGYIHDAVDGNLED